MFDWVFKGNALKVGDRTYPLRRIVNGHERGLMEGLFRSQGIEGTVVWDEASGAAPAANPEVSER